MGIRKKDLKQKMAEYTYHKPSMEKKVLHIRKSVNEISAILGSGEQKKK
ncbi:hypothetical protein FACS1894111_09240 [Clostridia bacterium]|nr:hypothetical protein FACS1894111_09240 [Clostridia bacterium]